MLKTHQEKGEMVLKLGTIERNKFLDLIENCKSRAMGISRVLMEYKIYKGQPSMQLKVSADESVAMKKEYFRSVENSLYISYEKWIIPLFEQFCKTGDIIELDFPIQQTGDMANEFELTLGIRIPINMAGVWLRYLILEYPQIAQLYPFITEIEFSVRNHSINQIFFKLKVCKNNQLPIEKLESYEEQELFAKLSFVNAEIRKYLQDVDIHSQRFSVTKKDNVFIFESFRTLDFKIEL